MKNKVYVFILFTVFVGVAYLLWPQGVGNMSLQTAILHIKEENVTALEMQNENFFITLSSGEKYEIKKPVSERYTDIFAFYNVEAKDLEAIDLVTGSSEITRVNTLLPIAIIVFALSLIGVAVYNIAYVTGLTKMGEKSIRQKPDDRFTDVAGIDEAKEDLVELVSFLKDPKKFRELGAEIPRGVLLVGEPGTGKTLLARAVAGEADVSFYAASSSEFEELYVGVGAGRVRDLFKEARKNAPSIVFIDEIDSIGRTRTQKDSSSEQTINQILIEMDGFDKESNVIVLAATNRPDVLDTALTRPGRFDRKIQVNMPDTKGRADILRIHTRNKPLDDSVNLQEWASLTSGFSGADLHNLVNEAAIYAVVQEYNQINNEIMWMAFDKILGGNKRYIELDDKQKERLAYHESGHAIAGLFIPHANPVKKISIVPRGISGGHVLSVPATDKVIHTKEEIEAHIQVILAGQAAEEIFLTTTSSGSEADLKEATNLVKNMVVKWGMYSEGLLPYKDSSERTQRAITEILNEQYKKVKTVLEQHRDALELLSKTLITAETLFEKDLHELLNIK